MRGRRASWQPQRGWQVTSGCTLLAADARDSRFCCTTRPRFKFDCMLTPAPSQAPVAVMELFPGTRCGTGCGRCSPIGGALGATTGCGCPACRIQIAPPTCRPRRRCCTVIGWGVWRGVGHLPMGCFADGVICFKRAALLCFPSCVPTFLLLEGVQHAGMVSSHDVASLASRRKATRMPTEYLYSFSST